MCEAPLITSWFRRNRNKALLFGGFSLLAIQILIAYFLPIFDHALHDQNKRIWPGQQRKYDDDVYISSSSSSQHIQPAKESAATKENVVTRTNVDTTLRLNELAFVPVCDIGSIDAISAVRRATTQYCKEKIINITCAIESNNFYPYRLVNNCPSDGHVANKQLGCYRDDKKERLLKGYYSNLKTKNTPQKCIQLCLQSGFVYAGVQYS